MFHIESSQKIATEVHYCAYDVLGDWLLPAVEGDVLPGHDERVLGVEDLRPDYPLPDVPQQALVELDAELVSSRWQVSLDSAGQQPRDRSLSINLIRSNC